MRGKKRSIKGILLAVCLCIATVLPGFAFHVSAEVVIGPSDTSWYKENATTFEIRTAEELYGFEKLVNTGKENFAGKTIKLAADIVLNEGNAADWATKPPRNPWTPVGFHINKDDNSHFKGIFDGQGHSISGVYVKGDTETYDQGFFGVANGATIQNLSLVNSYICGAYGRVAGLLGCTRTAKVTIQNCHVDAIVETSVNASASNSYGGLVGLSITSLDLIGCTFRGTVKAYKQCGGMLGGAQTAGTVVTIDKCVNYGNIVSTISNATDAKSCAVGGLIGELIAVGSVTATIKNSANLGALTAVSGTQSGVKIGAGELIGKTANASNLGEIKNVWVKSGDKFLLGYNRNPGLEIPTDEVNTFNSHWDIPATVMSLKDKLWKSEFSIETLEGASVRLGTPTGLRFVSRVNHVEELLGVEGLTLSFATIIAPTDYLTNGKTLQDLLLGEDDSLYVRVAATTGKWYVEQSNPTGTHIAGTLSNVLECNYTREFSAIGYCTVTLGEETVNVWSDTVSTRSIAYVAEQALRDPDDPYTDSEKALLRQFCQDQGVVPAP